MTTSFTATPEPSNVPPRVRLDFDAGAGAAFTELTVKRNGKAIREQPFAGGQTALAYDYEAPFGSLSTYAVTGSILPAASPDWTENWASLASWSGSTGSWSVSGGKAQTSTASAPITRSASGTIQRVSVTAAQLLNFEILDAANVPVLTVTGGTSAVSVTADNSSFRRIDSSTISFTVTFGTGTVTVSAADSSWAMPDTYTGTPAKIRLSRASGTAKVGQIAVTLVTTATPYADTETATLDVDQAWLIHPSQPSLSTPIDSGTYGTRFTFVEASSADPVTSQAVRTIHRPTGRRRPVVVTHGPRQADEWTLSISAATVADKDSVRAVVDDQTPLLLRVPPAFNWDLPDDWYSVGDLSISLVGPTIDDGHLISLPLTPVDEPIVRQGALRTYGDVLLEAATYGDLTDMYDTYLDLLAGDVA